MNDFLVVKKKKLELPQIVEVIWQFLPGTYSRTVLASVLLIIIQKFWVSVHNMSHQEQFKQRR